MNHDKEILPTTVLHWNYRGFTEFPLQQICGEESDITDIYLKENLISRLPSDIGRLENLESLYLTGNDITELPREISKLQNLKCLDVSGNRLRCIPDEIGEVRELKFLILDENELQELPDRINELRALRYLSVCDNKLLWLSQRPVYNYYHCEFRFWRNTKLKAIPYYLWYHMYRNQQIRSAYIGCLDMLKSQNLSTGTRFRLQLDNEGSHLDIQCPAHHKNVCESVNCSPASLYELSKRIMYQLLQDVASRLTNLHTSEIWSFGANYRKDGNDLVTNLETRMEDFNMDNVSIDDCDINGNNYSLKLVPSIQKRQNVSNNLKIKSYYFAGNDIVEKYFNFLPSFIRQELCNGPLSRCENLSCKKAIFDYVYYEFTTGKVILINNTQDVILSATFCSKHCALSWKNTKTNILPWTLVH